MTTIKGSDVLGIVNGIPIFCGLGLTFTEDKDAVERTGGFGNTGLWTYNALVKRSWSVEISGLTKIDPTDGQEDYFTMISDPFAYNYQTITLSFTDQDGNNVSIMGVMFLQGSSITGPATGFANASVKFIGTGEYILSTDGSGSSSGSGGSSCIPVSGGTFDPGDGTWGTSYSYSFPLSGTAPFFIIGSTKPAWMSGAIVGTDLVLSGTPNVTGTGIVVQFNISNPCGTDLFSATIDIGDGGRSVFVINNTTSDIVLTNSNGFSYTFLASNGSDGNFFMQTASATVTSITPGATVTFTFLQSLPSTVINTGSTSGGVITSSNFSITNYLRFS